MKSQSELSSGDVLVRFGERDVFFDGRTDVTKLRAETALKKEPGTIRWIDRFPQGAVFWDIGANVGVFSLYAAVTRGCRVFAFEPVAANYNVLNYNIVRNKLDSQITALPIAISDQARIDTMRMRDAVPGSALHVFGSNVDFKGDTFVPVWQQGAISLPIDDLCQRFGLVTPNYVKIDVDGIETAVVTGGAKTFKSEACRSVLVEVDPNNAEELSAVGSVLASAGMRRDDSIPENTVRFGKGRQYSIYNLIFSR